MRLIFRFFRGGGSKGLGNLEKTGQFFPNFHISNGWEILLEIWKKTGIFFFKFPYFQRAGDIVGNLEQWKFFTSLDHTVITA